MKPRYKMCYEKPDHDDSDCSNCDIDLGSYLCEHKGINCSCVDRKDNRSVYFIKITGDQDGE